MPEIDQEQERLAQAKVIEYLALSGGGAKGSGYPGVFAALQYYDLFKRIKSIGGTSAGSIAATIAAFGITPEVYAEISRRVNLKDLLGAEGYELGRIMLSKDATPLHDLILDNILKKTQDFLTSEDLHLDIDKINENFSVRLEDLTETQKTVKTRIEDLQKLKVNGFIDEKGTDELHILTCQDTSLTSQIQDIQTIIPNNYKTIKDLLQNKVFKSLLERSKKRESITFGDLAMLRSIDPEQFKDLNVTAVNKKTGELMVFNGYTGHVSIALACKASSAIPHVFKPVEIDGIIYMDGGCRNNIPSDIFDKKTYSEVKKIENLEDDGYEILMQEPGVEKLAHYTEDGEYELISVDLTKVDNRVLSFAFGNNDKSSAHIAVYGSKDNITNSSSLKTKLVDLAASYMIAGEAYSKSQEALYQKLRENAHNVVILDTGTVTTLAFEEAQRLASLLYFKAFIQTSEHIESRDLNNGITMPNLDMMRTIIDLYEEYDKVTKSSETKLSPLEKLNQDKYKEKLDALLEIGNCIMTDTIDRYTIINNITTIANVGLSATHTDDKFLDILSKTLNKTDLSLKVKVDIMYALDINIDITKAQIAKFQFTKDIFKRPVDHVIGRDKKTLAELLNLPSSKKSIHKPRSRSI